MMLLHVALPRHSSCLVSFLQQNFSNGACICCPSDLPSTSYAQAILDAAAAASCCHRQRLSLLETESTGCCGHVGDQVGHLWWRILNGELPKVKQPKVYTMLIGTNDIFAADCNRNETELLATVPGIAERCEVLFLAKQLCFLQPSAESCRWSAEQRL